MIVHLLVALVLCCKVLESYRMPAFGIHRLSTLHQPSHLQDQRKPFATLFARPNVGEVVVAEVDDIGGSIKEPQVFFNIKDGNNIVKAWMGTSRLSSSERMALVAGNMVKVRVTGEDPTGELRVSLPDSNGDSIDSYRSNVKPSTKSTNNRVGASNSNYSNNQNSNKQKRSYGTSSSANSAPVMTEVPANGLLLNNLKTGHKLEGIVVHATPQVAFVAAGVYRKAKGGVFAEVNGLLRKDDISRDILSPSRRYSQQGPLLDKGSKLTVYVKEVFKNAGRISFTTDGTVNRDAVAEKFVAARQAGKERRQSRRLRRQLESVLAGDTVTGTVSQVLPQGVLIDVTSLGPLNVTALLGQQDLPPHLQPPERLKDEYAVQLLQTDFLIGRTVTCGVQRVHPDPHVSRLYNMKLLLEELGPLPAEAAAEVTDLYPNGVQDEKWLRRLANQKKGLADVNSEDDYGDNDDEEDDEDYDDEEGDEDDEEEDEEQRMSDINDIFQELCASDEKHPKRTIIQAQELFDWADIQDMLADQLLSESDVHAAVSQAGVTDGRLTLQQFSKIVDLLQEAIERNNSNDEDDDENDDETNTKQKSAKTMKMKKISLEEEEEDWDSATPAAPLTIEEYDDDGEDEEEELFQIKPKASSKTTTATSATVKAIKPEVTETKIVGNSNNKKKVVSLEDEEDEEEDDSDYDEEEEDEDYEEYDEEEARESYLAEVAQAYADMQKQSKTGAVTVSMLRALPELQEMLQEEVLSSSDFDEVLKDAGLFVAEKTASSKKKSNTAVIVDSSVSLEQFRKVLDLIDERYLEPYYTALEEEQEEQEEEEEDYNNEDEDEQDEEGDEADVEQEEEEEDSLVRDMFDSLLDQYNEQLQQQSIIATKKSSGKSKKDSEEVEEQEASVLLPLSQLLQWEEVQTFGLSTDTLRDLALTVIRGLSDTKSVSGKKASKSIGAAAIPDSQIMMTFEHFKELLMVLDETAATLADVKNVLPGSDEEEEEEEEDGDLEEEEGEQLTEEEVISAQYEGLLASQKDKQLTVAGLRQWEVLSDLLADDGDKCVISASTIDQLICEALGLTPGKTQIIGKRQMDKVVNKEQFAAFYLKLDEALTQVYGGDFDYDEDDENEEGDDEDYSEEDGDEDKEEEEITVGMPEEEMQELYAEFRHFTNAARASDKAKQGKKEVVSKKSKEEVVVPTLRDLRQWDVLQELASVSGVSDESLDAVFMQALQTQWSQQQQTKQLKQSQKQKQTAPTDTEMDEVKVDYTLFSDIFNQTLDVANAQAQQMQPQDEIEDDDESYDDEEGDNEDGEYSENDEVTEEELRSLFQSLIQDEQENNKKTTKSKAERAAIQKEPVLSVNGLKQWGLVQQILSQQAMSPATLDKILSSITGEATPKHLTFHHFQQVFGLLEEAMELALQENGDDDDDEDDEEYDDEEYDEDEEDDESTTGDDEDEEDEDIPAYEDMTEADRHAMLAEVYQELRQQPIKSKKNSKNAKAAVASEENKVTVGKLMQWDLLKETVSEGLVTEAETLQLLQSVCSLKSRQDWSEETEITEKVFVKFTEALDSLLDERTAKMEDDEEEIETVVTSKNNKKPATSTKPASNKDSPKKSAKKATPTSKAAPTKAPSKKSNSKPATTTKKNDKKDKNNKRSSSSKRGPSASPTAQPVLAPSSSSSSSSSDITNVGSIISSATPSVSPATAPTLAPSRSSGYTNNNKSASKGPNKHDKLSADNNNNASHKKKDAESILAAKEREAKMKRSTDAGFGRTSKAEIEAAKLRARERKVAAVGASNRIGNSGSEEDDTEEEEYDGEEEDDEEYAEDDEDYDDDDEEEDEEEDDDWDSSLKNQDVTDGLLKEEEETVLSLFQQLKGKDNKVSLESFRNWEDLQDLISCGAIKETDVERSLAQVLGSGNINKKASLSMDIMQFSLVLDSIQESVDLLQADETLLDATSKEVEKCMKELAEQKKTETTQDLRELVRQDFAELQQERVRAQKKQQKKQEKEVKTIMMDGDDEDEAVVSTSKQQLQQLKQQKASKNSKTEIITTNDDDEDDEDDEDYDEEEYDDEDDEEMDPMLMEENEAKQIFATLVASEQQRQQQQPQSKSKSKKTSSLAATNNSKKPATEEEPRITLQTFLQWEEVQTLLTLQVLSEETVATSMSAVLDLLVDATSATASKSNFNEQRIMTLQDARLKTLTIDFQQFYDLISLITQHVDRDRLDQELQGLGINSQEDIEELQRKLTMQEKETAKEAAKLSKKATGSKGFGRNSNDHEGEKEEIVASQKVSKLTFNGKDLRKDDALDQDDEDDDDDSETAEMWKQLEEGLPTDEEELLDEQRIFLDLLTIEDRKSNPGKKAVVASSNSENRSPLTDAEMTRLSSQFISASTLKNWEELKQLVAASLLSKQQIETLLESVEDRKFMNAVEVPKGKLCFADFQNFLRMMDEILLAEMGDLSEDEDDEDYEDDDDDEDDEDNS